VRVRDAMSTDLQTLGRNDVLALADDVMTQRRIRHLPVLEGGRLVGIVTEGDFVALAARAADGARAPC